ncbi:DUF3800 domain-containing protein [Enterococcus malodoratus]|uniref:DUF3800 domain-containing protein n=1 Tax=Enterococcus malodoratus TaxID=71451 RepID=UPI0020745F4E|nr:DUF3800 domain-containing protein [Enterococcus malodoratus]
MDWKSEPAIIDSLSDVDCLLAIDENGTSTLKNAHLLNDNNKLFTITGTYFDMNYYNQIMEQVVEFKESFWLNGMYKEKRVLLHSKDLRKKQGAFNPKIVDYPDLINELDELLSSLPIKIYSASIDKRAHFAKYVTPFPVYELGVEFIIERFCFELRRKGKKGIVLLESRGRKEDYFVLEKMKKLLETGNDYNDCDNFSNIIGVYFNPKRTRNGKQSYWPLEISDIISYRIHNYVKTGVKDSGFVYIEDKIFGYPSYEGRGIKTFP